MKHADIVLKEQRSKFLDSLRDTAYINASAQAVGLTRRTIYNWREKDKEFAREMDLVLKEAAGTLEDEAVRRARDGIEKDIYYKGEKIGVTKEYSDLLLMFLLNGNLPEKYKKQSELNIKGDIKIRINKFASKDDEKAVSKIPKLPKT
mgnify:CR=1